jgi:hypothetical protein
MSLFKKKDDHPGSGIDKPEAKGLVDKIAGKVKAVSRPQPPPKAPSAP